MYKMKKILFIIFFSISINSFSASESSANRYGSGELKLSPMVAEYFIQYIRGKQFKYPSIFYVSLDGKDAIYWYCEEQTNCRSGSPSQERAKCMQVTGQECAAFARKRTIKWESDLNPGKGKISKINNKWTDQEIKDKLRELGFLE